VAISHGEFMETSKDFIKPKYLSDFAVLLKKMRLLKKLTRQQAGLLFDFTYKKLPYHLGSSLGMTVTHTQTYF
jgi:hypothetical protein